MAAGAVRTMAPVGRVLALSATTMAPAVRSKRVPLQSCRGQTNRIATQGEAADATDACVDHQYCASAVVPGGCGRPGIDDSGRRARMKIVNYMKARQ